MYSSLTGKTLTENQTCYLAMSVKAASGSTVSMWCAVGYQDAAGNQNYVGYGLRSYGTGRWQRLSATVVVPSGMHVVSFDVQNVYGSAAFQCTSVVISYGDHGPTIASATYTHKPTPASLPDTGDENVTRKVELTFTDARWSDVGLIEPYDGDFAWGTDENDFSIDVQSDYVPPKKGLLYAEGSDIGGMVRGYTSESASGVFTVVGDTWTGIIDRRVLRPPSGSAYYTFTGDVRDGVADLVGRLGLGYLFTVAPGAVGVKATHTYKGTTSTSQQDSGRYMGGWSAMWQLVSEHGCKVRFAWDAGARKVVITVAQSHDWTDEESLAAGVSTVGVSESLPVNHLVCLGQGEGTARTVLDLYADARGGIGTAQTQTGADEIAEVYDDSGASDSTKLLQDGTKKLRSFGQRLRASRSSPRAVRRPSTS